MTFPVEDVCNSNGSDYSTTPNSVLEIHEKELEILKYLGNGSFGTVEKAIWHVALDKPYVVAVKTTNAKKDFKNELHKLAALEHKNIIRLFGITTINSKIALVMEYAECGSLYALLHPQDSNQPLIKYTHAHVMNWSLQCAEAMEYLHSIKPKPIVHRDLKPPNLLLTDLRRVLKICDFGTASFVRDEMTATQGSIIWMAPEVFNSTNYTEKCDVYSFGIILWEMLTREKPYSDMPLPHDVKIITAVSKGKRPHPVEKIPIYIDTLMKRCWDHDPKLRPSFTDIVATLQNCRETKGEISPIPDLKEPKYIKEDEQSPPLPKKRQVYKIRSLPKTIESNSNIQSNCSNKRLHEKPNFPIIEDLDDYENNQVVSSNNLGQYFMSYMEPSSPLLDIVTGKEATDEGNFGFVDFNGSSTVREFQKPKKSNELVNRNEDVTNYRDSNETDQIVNIEMHPIYHRDNNDVIASIHRLFPSSRRKELQEELKKLEACNKEITLKIENLKNERKLKKENRHQKLKKKKESVIKQHNEQCDAGTQPGETDKIYWV